MQCKLASFFLVFLFVLYAFSFKANAQSPSVPIIFIPGYAASSPKKGEGASFVFNRGFSPKKLKLSPSYDTLVFSLKKAGYKEGKTFFGAVYDWRMTAAPADGNLDGILENLTAKSITSRNYSYAVNYLGYWLDRAVQANHDLKYVDIVTHSTGGILARAYIQSQPLSLSLLLFFRELEIMKLHSN